MNPPKFFYRPGLLFSGLAAVILFDTGCATNVQTAGLVVGVTAAGARSPGQEIEQTYYLGVFDPQEQVPPLVYRVTVHGQASIISLMKFGTGWVPASVVDSLNSTIGYDSNNNLKIDKAGGSESAPVIQAGRRLVLFGPEGFREAPKDQRLVIVMGTNPSKYFEAINQAFQSKSDAAVTQQNNAVITKIVLALAQTQGEQSELQQLQADLKPAAN